MVVILRGVSGRSVLSRVVVALHRGHARVHSQSQCSVDDAVFNLGPLSRRRNVTCRIAQHQKVRLIVVVILSLQEKDDYKKISFKELPTRWNYLLVI